MHGLLILLYGIPFIVYDNNTLTCLMGISGNVLVLIPDTFFSIDDYKYDITSFNGTHGTQNRIFFNVLIDLAALSDSGCVNDNIFLAFPFEWCIYGISGSALDIGNNDTLLV